MRPSQWIKHGLPLLLLAMGHSASIAASESAASESGFYAGVSLGGSSFDLGSELENYNTQASTGLDDSSSAWKIAAGYQVNRYLAFELDYVDLGEATGHSSITYYGRGNFVTPARADFSLQPDGPVLAAIGSLPIGNFEINLRLGIFLATTDQTIEIQVNGSAGQSFALTPHQESDESQKVVYGIGFAYEFFGHLALTADWSHYEFDTDSTFGTATPNFPLAGTINASADVATAGVSYRF